MKRKQKEAPISPTKPDKNAPESPYLAARREWNERYGSYIVRANHWRLVAFGSVVVAIIAVTGLVVISAQHKVVPFIVETNVHGEPWRVHSAAVASKPNENHLKAALRQWLLGARTVYADTTAQRSILNTTYAMTLPNSAAYQKLAEYHRDNNPYRRPYDNDETVEITVRSVVAASDESWQVEWTELVKRQHGGQSRSQDWQGIFTIMIAPPTSPQQVMENPLGIYVRQFSWTPRL